MKIIPVIDLLNGLVVHAQLGNRTEYKPVHSPLCRDPQPLAVLREFFSIYPFEIIYIADLNAIQNTGNHNTVINTLINAYPNVKFWIDTGARALPNSENSHNTIPVIGTESICYNEWKTIKKNTSSYILSLDYKKGILQGPKELLNEANFWPNRVIALELSHVGSLEGPNLSRLEQLKNKYFVQNLIAAGGIRNSSDIESLIKINCDGVLIASALHNQSITALELNELARNTCQI